MRKIGVSIIAALFIALSCSDDDNGPTDPVPVIMFEDLAFIDGGSNYSDTLKLTILFKDGDMDLGLNAEDTDPPFHPTDFFLADGKGDTTKIGTRTRYSNRPPLLDSKSGEKNDLITYRTRLKPGYDFLPSYEKPYSCTSYRYDSIFISVEDTAVFNKNEVHLDRIIPHVGLNTPDVYVLKDTFYYEKNPHYNNIHIDVLVEKSAGNFEVFGPLVSPSGCFNIYLGNARLHRLEGMTRGKQLRYGYFTITGAGRGEGELRYNFTTPAIQELFGGKRIKLRMTMEDRALHLSNKIETLPVEIPSI